MDGLLDFDADYRRALTAPWGPYGRDLTLGVVALASKFLLQVLNSTTVLGHDTYTDLVYKRPPGVGLLTVSNHTSTFDDPGLPCAMLPWHFYWTDHAHGKVRWTMCAADICFKNELLRQFFLNGKTLPVERGGGVDQPGMRVAAAALGSGEWLHIFPEGRVTPDGSVGPFKQGIGRLVCDARAAAGGRDPILLPYYHSGMARVMPFKSTLPRPGNAVHVAIGEPLELEHITCRCGAPGEDQEAVWRDIAAALRSAVVELGERVPPNPNQVAERPDVAAWEAAYQARAAARRSSGVSDMALPDTAAVSGAVSGVVAAQQRHQQREQQQQQQAPQHWLLRAWARCAADSTAT